METAPSPELFFPPSLLAGYTSRASFDRGRRYYDQRRVMSLKFGGRHATALVRGSGGRVYTVEVDVEEGKSRIACDCPIAGEAVCKHGVAVMLALWARATPEILHQRAQVGRGTTGPRTSAPAQPTQRTRDAAAEQVSLGLPQEPPPPARGPHPGISRAALEDWARRHGVFDFLGLPLHHVPGVPWSAHAHGAGRRLHEVLVTPLQSTQGQAAARVAASFLEQRAAEVAAVHAAQQTRAANRTRPADPAMAQAYDQLLDIRSQLAPVRLRPATGRGTHQLESADDPPGFVYREQPGGDSWWNDGMFHESRVRIESGKTAVTCTCPNFRFRPCAAAVEAIEHALDVLGLPEHAATAARLREAIVAPPWLRALRQLDAAPSPKAASEEAIELGWAIHQDVYKLQLEPVVIKQKKRGGTGAKRMKARTLAQRDQRMPTALDGALLDAALLLESFWERSQPRSATIRHALDLLRRHPRIYFLQDGRDLVPASLHDAPIVLHVSRSKGGLALELEVSGRRRSLDDAAQIVRQQREDGVALGWDAIRRRIAVTPLDREHVPDLLLRYADRLRELPLEALPELLPRLATLPTDVALDDSLDVRSEPVQPKPSLRLALEADDSLTVAIRIRATPEHPALVPGEPPEALLTLRDGVVVQARRELAAEEQQALALADGLGLSQASDAEPWSWRLGSLEASLDLLARVRELADVEIEWAGPKRRQVATPTASALKLQLSAARDWLGVSGGLDVDGEHVSLAALLQAVREGRRFVTIGPERFAQLDALLRRRLASLAAVGQTDRAEKTIALSQHALPVLADLAEAHGFEQGIEVFTRLRQRVEEAATLPVEVPATLGATLRPYQRDGFTWMARLAHWTSGACLADDMGLGKTIQALALLLHRASLGPALVVCPTSVGFNWLREAARFAPGLEMRAFRGKADQPQLANLKAGVVVVTSYDLLARYSDALGAETWATAVLDEAQAIKNADSQRARAAFALRADFRLALTGTPLENRTGEIWSLFNAIAPGLLATASAFRERFAGPIERDGDAERRSVLARLIRPFVLRRVKAEVAPELPPRTEIDVEVELGRAERERYEAVRLLALSELARETKDDGPRRFQILAALTRLRQLACHPRLVDPAAPAESAKLTALLELLRELRAEGHKALVFSQFTSLLAIVRDALDAEGFKSRYLDGQTPAARRREEVDAFQAGQADLFLLSLKAGGTGLNLTAANYVIHLDPWWNPAVEDQATDRAHRIGQDRAVTVYRLVARQTIEQAVLALHAHKRALFTGVLEGTGEATSLSLTELQELLALSASDPADEEAAEPAPPEVITVPASRRSNGKAPTPRQLAPPTPRQDAPAPVKAGKGWPDKLADHLYAAADAGRIKPSTAENYIRAGHRLEAYASARGCHASTLDALEANLDAYLAEVEQGTWRGPASDRIVARAMGRWLREALAF